MYVQQVAQIKQLRPSGHRDYGPVKWNHCNRVVHRLLIEMGILGPQAVSGTYFTYLLFLKILIFHSTVKYI